MRWQVLTNEMLGAKQVTSAIFCVCVWGEGVLVFNYASEPTSCAARLSRRFYCFLLSLLLFYVRVLREIK